MIRLTSRSVRYLRKWGQKPTSVWRNVVVRKISFPSRI